MAFGRSHPVLVLPLGRLEQYNRILSIHAANPTLTGSTWHLYARARNVLGRELTRQEATYLYRVSKAVTLNGLAADADRLGRMQQAESFSREALHVLLEINGPSDPLLRSQFAILRQYCYQRGDWQCAEHYARRVVDLDIAESRTRGHLPDIGSAVNLQGLAGICARQGKSTEAAALYAKALETYEREMRRNDPYIVNCLEEYANVLTTLGRGAEAEQLRTRAGQARRASPLETGSKRAAGV
jgi:tetratricopeptide (TPR) repeat protein